jgi:exodeoxyribonuclease VII large subunit
MSQMNFFQPATWTVGELTRHVRELLEGDPALQDVWVLGEVSNLSRPSSGHLYFTIKDTQASLRCVMWRNVVQRQPVIPRDGDAIEVHGSIGVYEAGGQYQLYADLIRPAGEGALYQEYLRLKARLEAEGLFDPERKKPLPRWPHRIGIVTSPTGAALRDMLNTLRRRYPLVEVILTPTPVQGEAAPAGIVAAIQDLNRVVKPDVILLARGGGSIEDLWAFNDEGVARAIVGSQAPVVSGVGHETDFTIADFASDRRAPTPTAAAELVTPDRRDLLAALTGLDAQAGRAFQALLNQRRWAASALEAQLRLYSPIARVRSDRQQLDEFIRRSRSSLRHRLRLQRANLQGFEQQLASLSPDAVLGRGYAIVSREEGALVSSVTQVSAHDPLDVRVSDGEFGVRVRDVEE